MRFFAEGVPFLDIRIYDQEYTAYSFITSVLLHNMPQSKYGPSNSLGLISPFQ